MRAVIVPLLVLVLAIPAARADEKLPRYNLGVGRKLTYTTSSESKPTDGSDNSMSTSGTWQITVVRENADGSRRVILKSTTNFSQTVGGNVHASPERVETAYADVFPDGRVVPNASLGMMIDPSAVLPPLPADEKQLGGGWSSSNEAKMETTKFAAQAGSGTGGEFVFTGDQQGVLNKIYAMTQKTTFHFDRDKGVIISAELEQSQDYGFHNKGTGSTKLEFDETMPAEESKQMADDFDVMFKAKEQYEAKMRGIDQEPAHADEFSSAAKSLLEKAQGEAKSDSVRQELAKLLEKHEEYAKYEKDSAGRFNAIMNQPSPDWAASDINGKAVALADYKGKVVVMDFWYRGCGWCMYAMPQVRQLAEDFKDKNVVVLGMNTDREEKDARFVIDAMQLKYPTIKAEGIPAKYGIQGFPTLIIIDQAGVVRDVHVGYSPTLRKDIGKKVEQLLQQGGGATVRG